MLGFDNRPAATPHLRFIGGTPTAGSRKVRGNGKTARSKAAKRAVAHNAPDGSFTPVEVAKLYNFPAGLNGNGQCIAIVELNDFDTGVAGVPHPISTGFTLRDLKAYFTSLGLPMPEVTAVGVGSDGGVGANLPGKDPNADGEVMLDIEVAGAVAPKAKIAVYFALNTDNGFLAAVNTALHDNVRKPSVDLDQLGFNRRAQYPAGTQGLQPGPRGRRGTWRHRLLLRGDDGSSDSGNQASGMGSRMSIFLHRVPLHWRAAGRSSSAQALPLRARSSWNQGNGGTGGGVSNFFARPPIPGESQGPKSPKGKAGRGVPDVAGDADPNTGYQVRSSAERKKSSAARAPSHRLGRTDRARQSEACEARKACGRVPQSRALRGSASPGAFHDIVTGTNDIEGLGKYKAARAGTPAQGLARLTARSCSPLWVADGVRRG